MIGYFEMSFILFVEVMLCYITFKAVLTVLTFIWGKINEIFN